MDLRDTEEESVFRTELRGWLKENQPSDWRSLLAGLSDGERQAFYREWQGKLQAGGWAAISWPREYGGRGASIFEQLIVYEEFALADTPPDIFRIATRIIGPMLIQLGRLEQKTRFLPRMASGEDLWCQGFSEPSAGSDLAGLRTRAEPDGTGFRITGQKVWNTFGHWADFCLVLARTNPQAPKHRGLTAFIVDMKSSGIDIRPLMQINGEQDFNEIFFDEVRVSKDDIVGSIDDGWGVAVNMLGHERRGIAVMGFATRQLYKQLLGLAKKVRLGGGNSRAYDDPDVRLSLAKFGVRVRIATLNNFRFAERLRGGGVPGPEGSIQKVEATELNKEMQRFGYELVTAGSIGTPFPQLSDSWGTGYLSSFGMTIAGGTSQIQRNIIGERSLGLPKQLLR